MNVKSIDIARALGISKSTVSLALNGKPGVSEQTRQEVLACKKQLEEHGTVPPGMFSRQPEQRKRQQIKIVKITNGMKNIQGAELNIINLRKKWKGICSQVPFIVLKYRQGCI